MTRPVHPNVIANHRFRWKQENKRDYPLTDKSIVNFILATDFTEETGSAEDDIVQSLMRQAVHDKENGL